MGHYFTGKDICLQPNQWRLANRGPQIFLWMPLCHFCQNESQKYNYSRKTKENNNNNNEKTVLCHTICSKELILEKKSFFIFSQNVPALFLTIKITGFNLFAKKITWKYG